MITPEAISHTYFIEAYRQSLGDEGASKLIKKILVQLPFGVKESYSYDQALMICHELKKEPGFLGMVADILLYRIQRNLPQHYTQTI